MAEDIKAVIFDLDNTLIDFYRFKKLALENAMTAMITAGLDIPREKISVTLDRIYKEKGVEYQHVFDDLLKELLGDVNPKILAAGIVAYRKRKHSTIEPYPTVVPTLTELLKRGYKLAIVTDAPRLQAWTRLIEMGLENFFEIVVCFEDSGQAKPSAMPFNAAISKLKLKPGQIVMIGDMLERDILGAQKLGMKTAFARYGTIGKKPVGLRPREIPKDIKPDYVIDDFSELLKFLK
jgi:putative hydrolase of the HAD superfamily